MQLGGGGYFTRLGAVILGMRSKVGVLNDDRFVFAGREKGQGHLEFVRRLVRGGADQPRAVSGLALGAAHFRGSHRGPREPE